MVVQEIVEVLYSPLKAFKKIIEKPDVKGLIIVLVLVVASAAALEYVAGSKRLLETRTPQMDEWTEALVDQHFWTSYGSLSLDTTDYQLGNSSVSCSAQDSNISLRLEGIGSINCSEAAGYSELFFWMNWTSDGESVPSSGTLKLFSGGEDSYFEADLVSYLPSNGEWANTTLNVGLDQNWVLNNSPDWQDITGVEFSLDFSDSANVTVKVDGLFFRDFITTIEAGTFYVQLVSVVIQVGITWVLWSGLMMILAKLFQEDLGKWNVFFIIVGHVFIVNAVLNVVSAGLVSALPTLKYALDSTVTYYYPLEPELWLSSVAFQVLSPLLWVGYIWITGLSAVVVRSMKETTWGKALTIAVLTFGVRLLLSLLGF